MQKVLIAVPTITGDIRGETAIAITETIIMCREMGIEADFRIFANCPVLPVARNTLVAMFMADPDATDLFFIDYDVKYNADAAIKLLLRPEEIIAGAYRVKTDDRIAFATEPKLVDGQIVGKMIEDGMALIEADFLAAGFLRIKRSAIEKMYAAYPDLAYDENVVKVENRNITEAYDLFGMGIDKDRRRYTTEDFYFCKRWRDIGGKLWIYPNIDFDHVGKKAYSGNYHEHLMKLPGGRLEKASEVAGWTTVKELDWLAWQAERRETVVEIGCWMGRSTTALSRARGTVYAVDTWQGAAEHVEIMKTLTPENLFKAFLLNTSELKNVVPVRKPSVEAAKELGAVDMVFIDGAHDYDNVKADIEAWLPKVNPGGMICGHDYEYSEGVKQAVQELLPAAVIISGTDIWACTAF
jgi:predicted O-methyltransferase YrrM